MTDRLNNNVFFSETFFSRGADGVTDRLNNKIIFQKPFFREAQTVTDRLNNNVFFQKPFFSEALTYFLMTDRLNNNVFFQKPFFREALTYSCYGWFDGQTQQQCFFSETFLSRCADGVTDRQNIETFFSCFREVLTLSCLLMV